VNAVQRVTPPEGSIAPANPASYAAPRGADEVDGSVGVAAAADGQPALGAMFAPGGSKSARSVAPATASTNASVSERTDEQIPIRAVETLPSGSIIHSKAIHSEATHGIGQQEEVRDGGQEEFAAVPQIAPAQPILMQPALTAVAIAASGAPEASTAPKPGLSSSIDEQKTPVADLPVHRGIHEASGIKPGSTAGSPVADKPGQETWTESIQTPSTKTAHEALAVGVTNAAMSQPAGSHFVVAESSGIEASAVVRDPTGAHGTANTPATMDGSSAGPAPAPRESFAALDAGAMVGTPGWVHAGGRQAEAGFEDPELGWVGVRADLSGGSVHASVVPGSTEAAQALGGHLAGLSAYLSEQHTPVATLTMAAPGNSGLDSGVGQNTEQNPGQGMDQAMQQGAGQRGDGSASMAPRANADVSPSSTIAAAQAGEFDATAYARDGRGTHITVMA
ncbi:MAG: hypothetical protein ACRD4E_00340, partial [Bryobacteraceae bacterium]